MYRRGSGGPCRCCCRTAAPTPAVGTCCLTYVEHVASARRRRRSVAASISASSPDLRVHRRARSRPCVRASSSSWCTTSWMPSSSGDQVRVGDDARDLDDHVVLDVEAGHLEIDPHEAVVACVVGGTSTARYRVAVGRFAAGEHSRRRLATRRRTPARRATWRGSWPRTSIATFAELVRRSIDEPEWFWDAVVRFLGLRFTEPYTEVLDTIDGDPVGASGSPAAASTSRSACVDRYADDPGARRRSPRSSGKARRATVRTLTCVELRDAHRPHRVRARRTRRRRRRRGRPVPADGARDGRRAVRGREARRGLPADLLRLRRRRGRGPARGRAARSRSITADGFTRRGRVVPMKETADAAVAQVPIGAHGRRRAAPRPHRRADAAGSRPHARRARRARQPDRFDARRGRQRASAVRRVHERHDRPAEGRGARARRLPREDRRGGRVPDGPAPRRAAVLAHRHRLDHGAVGDRRHARQRRHARALRRRARLSRTRPAVGVRRAAPRQRSSASRRRSSAR